MSGRWPLVGREEELASLLATLSSGQGVVLAGRAGVGKSRLAAELVERLQERGRPVARAVATVAGQGVPFGALAPVLPRIGSGANPLADGLEGLRALGGDEPLVLEIDDAHLLDELSATLLLQAVASGVVLVVATLRTGERVPEPVVRLWKDEHARRADLGPLPEETVHEMLRGGLGGPVDPGTLARIARAARGVPLAVRELVLGSREAGHLVEAGGQWRLDGELEVSPRLAGLVADRVLHLSTEAREALELVSIGEPLRLEAFEALTEPPVLAALDEAGLVDVREEPGGALEVWLAHPLHGEVLRAELSVLRRRALLRRLADALDVPAAPRADQLRAARWRLDAGAPVDPTLLLVLAEHSLRTFDHPLAARAAAEAWRQAPTAPTGTLYGLTLLQLGDAAEAVAVLEEAGALARDDGERVGATVARAEVLAQGLDRFEEALALVAAVRAELPPGEQADELDAYRAGLLCFLGRAEESLSAADPVLREGGLRPRVLAAMAIEPVLTCDAQVERVLALIDEAEEVHRAVWNADLFFMPPEFHEQSRVLALAESGELAAAEARSEAALAAAVDRWQFLGVAWFAFTSGYVALLQGRARHAAGCFERSIETFEGLGYRGHRRWPLGGLVHARALLGELDAALAAAALVAEDGDNPRRMLEALTWSGDVWLRAASGDQPGAAAEAGERARAAVAAGQRAMAGHLLHAQARLGGAADAAPALAALAEERPTALIRLWARHAAALAAPSGQGPLEELAAVAEEAEAAGALLVAAEAWAELARRRNRVDDRRGAASAARESERLLARCEGARTPALEGRQGAALELSAREREVALLARQDLTNKDIAARLYLSERTVENHLQRAYQKLGIRGRGELAAALGEADDRSAPRPR